MNAATFYSKAERQGDCLIWKRQLSSGGYGQLSIGIKTVLAHRHSYALIHGSVPAGMLVLHHCDNPPCIEPTHLYAGTHADNSADMVRRRRYCLEPSQPIDLEELKAALIATGSVAKAAKELGVSRTAIYRHIRLGHITVKRSFSAA